MPVYEYVCRVDGWRLDVVLEIDEYGNSPYRDRDSPERCCRECGSPTARLFSFSERNDTPAHYNQSAGEFVTGARSLRESFKRQSEIASERTGMPHNFVVVDPRDKDQLGITDDGLAATYDARKKLNMRIPDVVRPGNMS